MPQTFHFSTTPFCRCRKELQRERPWFRANVQTRSISDLFHATSLSRFKCDKTCTGALRKEGESSLEKKCYNFSNFFPIVHYLNATENEVSHNNTVTESSKVLNWSLKSSGCLLEGIDLLLFDKKFMGFNIHCDCIVL